MVTKRKGINDEKKHFISKLGYEWLNMAKF